ncbi:MerR family transcriptional regulator [Aquimarina algiphila]|uniref:MerR family transcriptional regulator n=1 Tax=Aquimarina algiphila TaxID=2047982 RepID=UPI00232E41A0|nr:MerR family transcriptional regulator [Aquimarina algiphila]
MKSNKEDFTPHSEALNELIFESKAMVGINRMTLHTWRLKGILDDKRDTNSTNRYNYYSALDVILIGLLNEMKSLRFSHAEMKACKEAILAPILAKDGKEYPALEYYTFLVLLYNQPIYTIITYNKGIEGVWMLDEKDYFSKLKSGEIENHTALSLHKAIKINLDPVYNIPEFCKLAGLTDDELKVIEIIRMKEYKTIRVLKKNGKMDCVEGTERIEDAERIEKMLRNGDYQNIEIKQNNDKITVAHRLVRTDFKR